MLIASGPSQPFTILKAALKNKTPNKTKGMHELTGEKFCYFAFVGFFQHIGKSYIAQVSYIPQDTAELALKVSTIIGMSNAGEKRHYLQRKWKEYLRFKN